MSDNLLYVLSLLGLGIGIVALLALLELLLRTLAIRYGTPQKGWPSRQPHSER